ncbi:MAG: SEC-C domain-containing protein [Isosphaeraceae bacterium]
MGGPSGAAVRSLESKRIMTTHADLLPAYRHLRQISINLNHKLVESLSKETLDEGGRRLGFLKKGIFVFDTEEETAILMDYCIHNVYVDGRNAAQRYMDETPPPPRGSSEMLVLDAIQHAYYSIFRVESVERGVGVKVRDALRGNEAFMMDIGLGNSAQIGVTFASRVIPFEGFLMSGGASLPLGILDKPEDAEELAKALTHSTDPTRIGPLREADLAAMVIRASMKVGSTSRIRYETPGESSSRRAISGVEPERIRANRNDPCPCGSGRKYKSCHGKR